MSRRENKAHAQTKKVERKTESRSSTQSGSALLQHRMPLQWPEVMAKERERAYMDYIVGIIQSSKKIEEGGVVHMEENKREVVGEATQDDS